MKKSVVLLFSLCLFSLSFNFTAAQEPKPSGLKEMKLSFNISLLEDTPIYNSPDETLVPAGVIAAQHVHAIGALDNWLSYTSNTDKKWFKVETWLGDAWISLELRKTGKVMDTDLDIWLSKNARLYNTPFLDSDTELALSSQIVHVRAQYLSKFTSSYLVETWAGEKWLVDLANDGYPVTKIHEQIELTTTTSKFNTPIPYSGDNGVFEPQVVTALQTYNNDWYHVITANGEEAWINKKFAQPAEVKQTMESVEVTVVTPLQKYPYVYEINMGTIAPQTVKAFETWRSPEVEAWYHIQSWQGDAWIRDGKSITITKETAMSLAKQMDPNGNALWTADLVSEFQVEPSKEIRPVWKVTAAYHAGNKMIVYIDAVTGKQVALTETEAAEISW